MMNGVNKLRNAKAPVVLAINKVDNIKNKDDLLPFITDLGSKFNFAHIVPMISAQRGNNVHQLEKIVRQSCKGVHHFLKIMQRISSALWHQNYS